MAQFNESRWQLQCKTQWPWLWDTGADTALQPDKQQLDSISVQVTNTLQPILAVHCVAGNSFDRYTLAITRIKKLTPVALGVPDVIFELRSGLDYTVAQDDLVNYKPDSFEVPVNTGWILQHCGRLATQLELWARIDPADPNAQPISIYPRIALDYIGTCDMHSSYGLQVTSLLG